MNRDILTAILDKARWAPSGDNSQPWSFRLASEDTIHVLGVDHSDTDVYDFDGRPTLLTLGFLLESMAIAASEHGATIEWTYQRKAQHLHHLEVRVKDDGIQPDALLPFIEKRSVVRGAYRSNPLSEEQKQQLQRTLAFGLDMRWFESRREKWRITRLNARATHIRLSIPEAFTVHQRILDWGREQSPDGVPAKAIGLDPVTLKSMQWVMQKWERADFMNRFAGGTMVPRLQMDLLPGLRCAAHFMVFQPRPALPEDEPVRLLNTGRSLQRFWLTATSLGLVMQPSLAPLCFAWYAEHDVPFTRHSSMLRQAKDLRLELADLEGRQGVDELVFMGRIGTPVHDRPGPRSVRKPLASLLIPTYPSV